MNVSLSVKTAKYIKVNRAKMNMNKKGEMPWWLMMLILSLVVLVIILGMVKFQNDKLSDFLVWLG
jgi:type VI protein secretion system component VasF